MKTRALVENGSNGEIALTSLEIPLIAKIRDSLILKRNNFLTLVGRIGENGDFMEKGKRTMLNQKTIPKYLLELNPRILILEDGRVFYDISKSDPGAQSETYEVHLFLGENFGAYGSFKERFERLYRDFIRA